VRIVTAASLFDGHDAAINIMRRILQSQGCEVIHLGHNRSVQEVLTAVVQEDAQGVAVSSYQGGHNEYFGYLVDELRALVRPGDVLCAVSAADEPTVLDAFRRARAWGALTIWIGAGRRPPAGAADHVLWSADPAADAALAPHDGSLSLRYHMLWELTHVCFDHPGLLTEDAEPCEGPVCITCSDEGRLGEVVAATGELDAEALVRTGEGVETVDTTLVGPLRAGDLVLVHAGSAITVVGDEP